MKFKAEYRWLLFILIPFVVLLVVHIVNPLLLLLSSQPVGISSYTAHNIDVLNTASRSHLLQEGQELAATLQKYASFATLLARMLTTQHNITAKPLNINNGHQFYQNYSDNKTLDYGRSMWFAPSITNAALLNKQQNSTYNSYRHLQPYLEASFLSKGFKQVVQGVFMSLNVKDSQIAFHYPSYPEKYYQNANSSINTRPFELLVNSGHNIIFINDNYESNSQNDIASLCQALLNGTLPIGAICIQLRLSALLKNSIHEFQVYSKRQIAYTVELLQLNTFANSSKLIALGEGNQNLFSISYPQNSSWSTFKGQWGAKACERGMATVNVHSQRRQDILANVAAVCVQQSGSQSSPLLFYSLSMQTNTLSTRLIESYTHSDVVKTLLTPILISILISIAISVVVLRYILNDLDLELFKINDYCKFIVEGDINIEIPEFKGTQDIIQIYQEVRIINKLFRYTSKDYFTGFYSNKILKYNEAIHVFKKLNYDVSFLYQNIGDSYLFIEEYEKAIGFLKQSIEAVEKQILNEYGSLQRVAKLKQDKDYRFSSTYKEKEVIMTRRLWKIFFVYMKYVELGFLNSKNFFGENLSEAEKTIKREKYRAEMVDYAAKLKLMLYPDYGQVSEGPLLFEFEAKFNFSCKNYEGGKACCENAFKYLAIYAKEYQSIGNKIKEKGSKNKVFFKKNKMSGHSRCKPEIIKAFAKNCQAIMKVFNPKSKDYIGAFDCLAEAVRSNYISQSVNFMVMTQFKKLLTELKIGLAKFQHTQIFRETMPYKTLHYGPITPETEPLLYRLPKSVAEVETREYLFLYDTASLQYPPAYCQKHISFMRERSDHIFDKLVKKIDRISIAKFNNVTEIDTGCNLTLKDYNQQILKKTYTNYLDGSTFRGKTWLITGLTRIISRIKHLQCQKVVLLFIRPIQSFVNDMLAKKVRIKSKEKLKSSLKKVEEGLGLGEKEQTVFPEVGQKLVELMREQGMRNCKLILMCSVMDDMGQVVRVFGLRDINRRIWAATDGLNKSNNTVFIIDDKHKIDIERLLVSKLANYADNHVFVF